MKQYAREKKVMKTAGAYFYNFTLTIYHILLI